MKLPCFCSICKGSRMLGASALRNHKLRDKQNSDENDMDFDVGSGTVSSESNDESNNSSGNQEENHVRYNDDDDNFFVDPSLEKLIDSGDISFPLCESFDIIANEPTNVVNPPGPVVNPIYLPGPAVVPTPLKNDSDTDNLCNGLIQLQASCNFSIKGMEDILKFIKTHQATLSQPDYELPKNYKQVEKKYEGARAHYIRVS